MWVGAACELDLDVGPTKRDGSFTRWEHVTESVALGSLTGLKGVGLRTSFELLIVSLKRGCRGRALYVPTF